MTVRESYWDWRARSKCSSAEADRLFFPPKGRISKEAKDFCTGCPVIEQCLQDALDKDLQGVWAGTTEKERRKMKKQLRRPSPVGISNVVFV